MRTPKPHSSHYFFRKQIDCPRVNEIGLLRGVELIHQVSTYFNTMPRVSDLSQSWTYRRTEASDKSSRKSSLSGLLLYLHITYTKSETSVYDAETVCSVIDYYMSLYIDSPETNPTSLPLFCSLLVCCCCCWVAATAALALGLFHMFDWISSICDWVLIISIRSRINDAATAVAPPPPPPTCTMFAPVLAKVVAMVVVLFVSPAPPPGSSLFSLSSSE